VWHADPRREDDGVVRFVLVVARRRADGKRPSVVAAEHAREAAQPVGHGDDIDILAAAPDPNAPVAARVANQTQPAASSVQPSGEVSGTTANVRRSESEPSPSTLNSVRRAAQVSATTSVRPSLVRTQPFGKSRSSATRRAAPSG
jgi:hypothetical protein